ncbi:MAG: hypothetical protein WCG25_09850 [bacterium]
MIFLLDEKMSDFRLFNFIEFFISESQAISIFMARALRNTILNIHHTCVSGFHNL